MASIGPTGTAQCPECKAPITFPASADHTSKTEVTLSIDPAPIRDHLATHLTRTTLKLPLTARG